MKLLTNSYTDPYSNLAFEEWYFRNFEDDSLRIWINPRSVIVGKHQNAMAEANVHYCMTNNIPVIRRISGGGTVFHDPGNINFSFFRQLASGNQINYDENLEIIRGALNYLDIQTNMTPRHDLYLGAFKISGNAQHVSKGRALHHGTLLYEGDLDNLRAAIRREGTFEDKAVKSVRSSVTNIRVEKDLGETSAFFDQLIHQLKNHMNPMSMDWTPDLELKQKYKSDEWNFGYGPGYKYQREHEGIEVSLTVDRGGNITECSISDSDQNWLSELLLGNRHHPSELSQILGNTSMSQRDQARWLKLLF